MNSLILVLIIASPAQIASPETVSVHLPDGRTIPGVIAKDTNQKNAASIQFSPQLAKGAFWSFGDTFQRALYYGCSDGKAPSLSVDALSCPTGSTSIIRPGVTLPDDPSSYPTSNVPPVVPGGRPVMQSMHVFRPWAIPVALLLIVLAVLAKFIDRKSQLYRWPTPESAVIPWSRQAWATVVGLTVFGGVLRLWTLGYEPLEQNEFTYFISGMGHRSLVGVFLDVNGLAQTHPPLYHLILYFFSVFGNTEWIARLPAAIAGILSIPLVFALVWRLLPGRLIPAAFVSAMMACSPVHVWYSQDVSPYTFTTLFSVLILFSAARVLSCPQRLGSWWGLVLGVWGVAYTHYYGLHLALAVFCVLLFQCTKRQAGWQRFGLRTLWAGIISFMGLLPWIPAFVHGYAWSRGHSTAYQRSVGVYHPEVDRLSDVVDVLRLIGGYPYDFRWLALLGIALVVYYFRRIPLSGWRWSVLLAPLVWFIAFEIINRETFLHTLYGGWYFGIRYGLFLFPVVWIIASALLESSWATRLFGALTVVLSLVTTVSHLNQLDKPDVRRAATEIRGQLKDGDALIVGPATFYQHPVHYYLARPKERASLGVNDYMQTPRWQNGWVGILSDIFEPYSRTLQNRFIRRVWVIDHTQHLFDRREFSDRPSDALADTLSGNFYEKSKKSFHDVTLSLYERRQGHTGAPPTEKLQFGWGDGPYVRGFEPPWAYASPGRRIRPHSQVHIPLKKDMRTQSITIRAGTMPPGGHQLVDEPAPSVSRLGVRVNGERVATLALTEQFTSHTIPVSAMNHLEIRFELERPEPGQRRPPEVVLDTLNVDY